MSIFTGLVPPSLEIYYFMVIKLMVHKYCYVSFTDGENAEPLYVPLTPQRGICHYDRTLDGAGHILTVCYFKILYEYLT